MQYTIYFNGYVVVEANNQEEAEQKVCDAMCEKVLYSDEFPDLFFDTSSENP